MQLALTMGFIYFAPTGQELHYDVIGYRYISPTGFFSAL